jgi:hypothetical protein
MMPRSKKCRVCKDTFSPRDTTQVVCSHYCAIVYIADQNRKKYDKETKRRKEAIKSRSKWLSEAQTAFNAFIRQRDAGNACISCGRRSGCKINAGHYRSVGAAPELRFEELNVHLQCEHCNSYKSGNAIDYRLGLIKKLGTAKVVWLEGKHDPKHYTIEDIKEIKTRYLRKTRELRK